MVIAPFCQHHKQCSIHLHRDRASHCGGYVITSPDSIKSIWEHMNLGKSTLQKKSFFFFSCNLATISHKYNISRIFNFASLTLKLASKLCVRTKMVINSLRQFKISQSSYAGSQVYWQQSHCAIFSEDDETKILEKYCSQRKTLYCSIVLKFIYS